MKQIQNSKPFINTFLFIVALYFSPNAFSQTDSSGLQRPVVELSGFMDVYYTYNFNQPKTNFGQPFLYTYNRQNQIALNLGFIRISAKHSRYRNNFALQAGPTQMITM